MRRREYIYIVPKPSHDPHHNVTKTDGRFPIAKAGRTEGRYLPPYVDSQDTHPDRFIRFAANVYAFSKEARCYDGSWHPLQNLFKCCKYFWEKLHTWVDFVFPGFCCQGLEFVMISGYLENTQCFFCIPNLFFPASVFSMFYFYTFDPS